VIKSGYVVLIFTSNAKLGFAIQKCNDDLEILESTILSLLELTHLIISLWLVFGFEKVEHDPALNQWKFYFKLVYDLSLDLTK